MTQTADEIPALTGTSPSRGERLCLVASLVISSLGIVASVVGWWLVRAHNVRAVESGGRIRDLVITEADGSALPALLFLSFLVGLTALILALTGARAAPPRTWLAVVAGVLAMSLIMTPVVVVANAFVVTRGVMVND